MAQCGLSVELVNIKEVKEDGAKLWRLWEIGVSTGVTVLDYISDKIVQE